MRVCACVYDVTVCVRVLPIPVLEMVKGANPSSYTQRKEY